MDHDIKRRVFICSPYRGDVKANVTFAKAACRAAVRLGVYPFAPHLLYPQFLTDDDPIERRMGMNCSRTFLEVCDEIWVCTKGEVSKGMQAEIFWAREMGKKVMRFQPFWFRPKEGHVGIGFGSGFRLEQFND